MRILCAWCETVLGEKCALCGGRAALVEPNLGLFECLGKGDCVNKAKPFLVGDGGVTTTICDHCLLRVWPDAQSNLEEIAAPS